MKWRVIINRSYVEMSFIFDTLEDAGAFLTEFVGAKEPDEDDERYKWRYSIKPVMEEEKNDKD